MALPGEDDLFALLDELEPSKKRAKRVEERTKDAKPQLGHGSASAGDALWNPSVRRSRREEKINPAMTAAVAKLLVTAEAARHRAVSGLAAKFQRLCGPRLDPSGKRWHTHFEAWLTAQKGAELSSPGHGTGTDPVIPELALLNRSDPELSRKLVAAGVVSQDADTVCQELGKAATKAARAIRPSAASAAAAAAAVAATPTAVVTAGRAAAAVDKAKFSVVTATAFETGRSGRKVSLSCSGVTVEVNLEHFQKLRSLYLRAAGREAEIESPARSAATSGGGGDGRGCSGHGSSGGGGGGSSSRSRADGVKGDGREAEPVPGAGDGGFTAAAFCVLARYSSLQGCQRRGGGFQAAIPGPVFDVLLTYFGVQLECFASPLNCRYSSFCSAFKDVDSRFGSIGSFFEFHPNEGSFQANPPFDYGTVAAMARHIDVLLSAATGPMSFAIVFPHWPDQACWRLVDGSRHKRHHLLLVRQCHGYLDGAQHARRKKSGTGTSFDSSLFFLQNSLGAQRWPVNAERCKRLQAAFGACCVSK